MEMGPSSAENRDLSTFKYRCPVLNCGKTYHRKEHLNRHEQSCHTLLRPHTCNVCNSRFTRKDVLKRHMQQHSKGTNSTGRALSACDRCHSRKSKCDGGLPCHMCLQSHTDCTRARRSRQTDELDVAEVSDVLTSSDSGSTLNAQSLSHMDAGAANAGDHDIDVENTSTQVEVGTEFAFGPFPHSHGDLVTTFSNDSDAFNADIFGGSSPSFLNPSPSNQDLSCPSDTMQAPEPLQDDLNAASGETEVQDVAENSQIATLPSLDRSPSINLWQPPYQDFDLQSFMQFDEACPGMDLQVVLESPGPAYSLPSHVEPRLQHAQFPGFNNPDPVDSPKTPQVPFDTAFDPDIRSLDRLSLAKDHFIQLYFSHFHPRWPILHRHSFLKDDKPEELVSSLVVIGAWLDGKQNSRHFATSSHNRQMEMLDKRLRHPPEEDRKVWPIAIYQAILLNILFAIYYGKEPTLSQAYYVNHVFITVLREIGLFKSQLIAGQDNPSDSNARRWMKREQIKRLAFAAYKVDCHLSILRDQPPLVRYQELCLRLACTDACWDSPTPFDTCHQWQEPQERLEKHFSSLIRNALAFNPRLYLPPLLAEDYNLGICAMQALLWEDGQEEDLEQTHLSSSHASQLVSHDMGLKTPAKQETWRKQLEYWKSSMERDANVGDGFSSLDRQRYTTFDSIMMYHLSYLGLYTDTKVLKQLATDPSRSVHTPSLRRKLETQVDKWVCTSSARLAVWHAVQICQQYSRNDFLPNTRERTEGLTVDPIGHEALFRGAIVLWSYCRASLACDLCSDPRGKRDPLNPSMVPDLAGALDSVALRRWFEGGGNASIDGVLICMCKMSELVGRFETHLLREGRTWQYPNVLAALLSNVKDYY